MAIKELNVKKLQNMGTIVLLTASPKTVLDRVKENDDRPLLKDKMNVEALQEMMNKRKAYYEKAAQIVVATDKLSPEDVADEIIERLSEKNS
jgi:shikimate kinase